MIENTYKDKYGNKPSLIKHLPNDRLLLIYDGKKGVYESSSKEIYDFLKSKSK